MMKNKIISGLFLSILLLMSVVGNSQVKDFDGQTYQTVKIGKQVWIAENLNVDHFQNGDLIPEAKTEEEWRVAVEEGKPVWSYYDNKAENEKKYGKIYNWNAVIDPRGLAPTGWHIPSDDDWTKLSDFFGGKEIAGEKLKSDNGWLEDGIGTNESGFDGYPGGFRYYHGFYYKGNYGYFWSSTEASAGSAWSRVLYYNNNNFSRYYYSKRSGFSVRCLKD